MNNTEIIMLAFILTVIAIVIWNGIKKIIHKIYKNKQKNRFNEIERLRKDGKLSIESIDLDKQKSRFDGSRYGEIIIDGKKYTDKEYYFALGDGKGYILGKKENKVIVLIGMSGHISED